ncbi:uncharacterized protein B0T23DRAFT_443578 [Neurospora hispaniola]|uniref:Uncharacterized protein n=1 Tax=Neurospora hispaniola TaxID=588809 RepID=A0AAJ0I5Y8_9PEZI|nr:hypothetical protein B0T23DRAFT_443578 [Neurospora hispaniola]
MATTTDTTTICAATATKPILYSQYANNGVISIQVGVPRRVDVRHGAKPQVAEQKGPPPSPPGSPVLSSARYQGLKGSKGFITGCRPSGELPTCHLHSIFPHLDTTGGLWAPVIGSAFPADSLGPVVTKLSPMGPVLGEPGSLDPEPDPSRGPKNRTCESSQQQRRPRPPSSSAGAGADGLGPYRSQESCSADPEFCIDPVGQYITLRK